MCRTLGLVCVLLLSLAPRTSARSVEGGGGTFTIEHYAKVARVSDVRIAPAGDRAVMVVAWPNYEANAWESEVVLVDVRTGAAHNDAAKDGIVASLVARWTAPRLPGER